MIYFFTPYSQERDLGLSYNRIMSLLPDPSDWACITDSDSMFTTNAFGTQIEAVIEENPDYSLFTCMTNRVANRHQVVHGIWDEDRMSVHRKQGDTRWDQHFTSVKDITNEQLLSGVMILTQRKSWEMIGKFPEGSILGIDNKIHIQYRNAGLKVGLMKGIYLMHYYRNGIIGDTRHLR